MKDWLNLWKRIAVWSCACLLLGLVLSSAATTVATAQAPDAYWFDVRIVETADAGIAHPRSAVYTGIADQLLVLDGKARATTILSYGKRVGSTNLPSSARWRNVAFDAVNNRLIVFDRNQKLQQLGVGLNLAFGAHTEPIVDLDLGNNAFRPQGVAYDSNTARLWVLDGATNQVLQTAPSSNISKLALPFAQGKLRGLTYNAGNQHLYTLGLTSSTLYEFTAGGDLVATRDFSTLRLNKPRALLFAPSSDNTDDPAELSLYIVEKGTKAQRGGILELSLTPPPTLKAAAVNASLVQTTVTGNWSPNAPDPAGVIYQPNTNHLLISDSEVEEMKYFVGKNMFEATLGGSLTGTFTSFTSKPVGLAWNNYTDEPTGLALNPDNNHLFVSEDSNNKVYEIDPRGDGILGTNDDTVTKFSTSDFGDTDTEDVAYGNGKLFVVDGAGREVYVINPGGNGRFDGVPPSGDDSVTHFDVAQYGVRDAEGLGFNTENNNLIVVDRRGPLVEVTQGGALVQSISLSFLNPIAPADVAVAPRSNNSSQDSLYIVDRMVDNNDNANETDGRLYEITLGGTPPPSPTATHTPTSTNTPTPTNTPTGTITVTNTPTPTNTPTNTPTGTGSTNLVRNPGFEVAKKNQPTEWSSWRNFFQSNELVHGGSFAGKFAATDNSGNTIKEGIKNLSGGIAYNASGWVNIPPTLDNFTFTIQLKWRDANNNLLRLDTLKNYTALTLGWDQASGTFVSPAGTTNVQVLLRVTSLDATIFVDDFSFAQ